MMINAFSLFLLLSTTTAIVPVRESVAVLRQFDPPFRADRSNDLRLARAGGNTIWVLSNESVERWSKKENEDFQRSGTWPLPVALTTPHALYLAPVDAKQTWVIDGTERRAWRLQDGTWSKVLQLGDEIAGAAALPSGDLVINTLLHSSHALAIIDTNGEVRARFGGRSAPKVALQTPLLNTWRIAVLANGQIAVAHGFLPLLRTYKATGELVRETAITIPSVAAFEERRRELETLIQVDVKECCISSKVVQFATAITAHGDEIAVRYALDPKLEIFTIDGSWKETVLITVPASKQTWLAAGMAYFGDQVAAAELDRVAVYRRVSPPSVQGLVLDEKGAPLADAKVAMAAAAGMRVNIATGSAGTFEIRGLHRGDHATVSITADGYLPLQRAGVLEEIIREPFTLRAVPEQCVVVRSAATGDVITKYRLQVGQKSANQEKQFRNDGAFVEINDQEGRGCILAPFTPPLLVRVAAIGHATREVDVSTPADVELELQAEIPVRLLTRSESGAPVPTVKIYLIPAEEKRGSTLAISDDSVTTTDEEGSATLRGVAAGDYVVIAEHPEYLRVEKQVKLEENAPEIPLVMERGGQMTVQVLDAATRQPLAASEVYGDPRGVPVTRAIHCTTGADGNCLLTGLPVGRYSVRVEHAGHARAHETVVLGPSERNPVVVFRLSSATAISGRVGGTEGYPGVALQVEVAKPGVPTVYAPIGADGEFRVSEAPTGNVSFWVTETEVDSMLLHRRVEIPDGIANVRVDLQLPKPVRLSGRILDPSDAGCGACSIVFNRIGGEYITTSRRGTTRGDGHYEVRLSATGPYMARIQDLSAGSTFNETFNVTSDGEHDFRIGGRSLEVRVKLQNGTGVANALVTVQSGTMPIDEAVADSYGVARFRSMAPGQLRVVATHEGRTASREITLSEEATTVNLVLSDAASLRLKVVDSVSQLALYRIEARVTGAGGETILRTDLVRDDEGVFVLPSFGPGPMTVIVEATGYAVRTMHGVVSGEAVQTVPLVPRWRAFTVEVDPATVRPCTIEVRDATGRPVAMSARAGAGPVPFTLNSALFSGLEWGIYQLFLRDCDGRILQKTLQLVEGGDWNVRFP